MKDLKKVQEFFSQPMPGQDTIDTISMDIPLFLRMLEYAKEDAQEDVDLHDVTQRATELSKTKPFLSMEDYNEIVAAAQEIDEVRLVPKDQIEMLATKLAAQVFSKGQDLKPAINILKKALEDSYRALDPNVEIKEEVGFLSLKDDNPFDDVPSIDIQMIDDKEGASSPKAFVNFSSMYHSGDNGKMEILRNNPALQDKVMKMLQAEFQKTFRRVIHGVLGEPFGLDEVTKGFGDRISAKTFSKLKGEKISYFGNTYKVIDSDEYIITLEDEDGDIKTVNLNQFIQKGIIPELKKAVKEVLLEKKKKRDRCLRIADRKFDKPSAYKSGAVVRCRDGEIWKDLKEVIYEVIQEDESLYKWFKRAGTPGKEGGWVDCNAPIRKDGKITGYKSCGRKKGEKRAKYPSCRPTAAKCKDPGKGKKWGKTK